MSVELLGRLWDASLQGGALALGTWIALRVLPCVSPRARAVLWWLVALKFALALGVPRWNGVPLLPSPGTSSFAPAPLVAGAGSEPAPLVASGLRIDWTALLAAAWLAGVAFQVVRVARDGLRVRAIRRRARRPREDEQRTFDGLRARFGLGAVELRITDHPGGPFATGVLRPCVLVPERDLAELDERALEMALAHELEHVRRRDLLLGWVPLLVRVLFFFHPLARLAAREYELARESACDEAALRRTGAQAAEYGALLLRHATARALGARTALSARAGELRARLAGLADAERIRPRASLPSIGLLLLVPACVANRPREGAPPVEPRSPTEPALAREPDEPVAGSHDTMLLVLDGETHFMSAMEEDVRAAKGDRTGNYLWFRRGGQAYVVRDRAVLTRTRAIFEPQLELGRKQADLGAVQAKLGAEQARLGAAQAELGRAQRSASSVQEVNARQRKLGQEQAALGARQAELGAQQAALGAEQRRAAESARRELAELIERALADGSAEAVP